MNLFLDTNALIKLYHHEKGTDSLLTLLENHKSNLILTITDLSIIEFHSAFLRRVRTAEIEKVLIQQVFSAFSLDLIQYTVIEIDKSIKNYAIHILDTVGEEKSLRTLDAIQISAALIYSRVTPFDYFVCSDKKFISVLSDFFKVFNPEDPGTYSAL